MDEPIYRKQFTLYGNDCDCFGRVKPATILGMHVQIHSGS